MTGRVINDSGRPVATATVTVLDGPESGRTVGTNQNGEYQFSQLPVGNTNFTARAPGYEEDRRGTFVNGTNTLNFTIRELPPPPPSITIRAEPFSTGPTYAEWRFTAVGTNVPPSNYRWEYGDGGAGGPSATDTHLFLEEGTFEVRVIATPTSGGSPITASTTIQVKFGG